MWRGLDDLFAVSETMGGIIWKEYDHVIYWQIRMCHHMTSPTTPPLWRAKTYSP